MNKLIAVIALITIVLSGCANMTQEQQTATGVGGGALFGALVGAAVGGKEGAAIGAGIGALAGGIAAHALANDQFTQSANQQAEVWQKQAGAQPELVKVSDVLENGESKQQIDVQSMTLSSSQVVANKRLLPKIKQQLTVAKTEADKTDGLVHVAYPADVPVTVLKDILSTGVSIEQDNSLVDGYVIYLARSRSDLDAINI